MNVIGVNVREVEGRARPIIAPGETGKTAFLIRSRRGPAHTPVTVHGVAEFSRVFGGLDTTTLGAAVVASFFDNGGSEATCVRVTRPAASVARQVLTDRTGAPTLRVEAGWHGLRSPGASGNTLQVTVVDNPLGSTEVPPQVLSANAAPFPLTDGDTLDVSIDGGAAQTVTFQAGAFENIAQATAEEVAAAIRQDAREALSFAAPGGRVMIAGRNAGPSRRIALSGDAATTLGFTGTTADSDAGLEDATVIALRGSAGFGTGQAVRISTHGRVTGATPLAATETIADGASFSVTVDGGIAETVTFAEGGRIADLTNATPDEVVAEINRQSRGFTAGLAPDGALMLWSNSLGASSTISLAAGGIDPLPALDLAGQVPETGLTAETAIAERSDADSWIRINPALPNGNPLPHGSVRAATAEVDIAVVENGVELERFTSVGMEPASTVYAVDVVNDALAGSDRIRLLDLASGSGLGRNLPAAVTRSAMTTTGSDPAPLDVDYAGNAASRTGLHALDTTDFELLALADTTNPAPAADAIAYCAARGTAIAIVTGPADADLTAMIDFAAPLRASVSYGVAIWPHGQVANPLDTTGAQPLRTIPLAGAYCGMLARVGRNSGVWTSPAGARAAILVTGLVPGSQVTDIEHTDAAVRGGVSVIRALPGQGIIADAARNLSTNPALRLVSQRRLTNLIKVSLGRGLRLFLQEPITPRLFAQVRDSVGAFMTGLWRGGAFGTEDREDGFVVLCDETNNPETQTQFGLLEVEVRFRTPSSAEFVVVEISQSPAETVAAERS
ncbi:hypothetical protein [Roseibium marinum]|uniref:Phage tail sheath protein FI n=1 Tax=Roseibium marinum TaxID=281252 RepID=A0A2S3UNF6_9HYPH|nr:hypothetical protein [Roseibium marinum]POF29093.1 phage tail sheath protein FI [Roseibium marinum]